MGVGWKFRRKASHLDGRVEETWFMNITATLLSWLRMKKCEGECWRVPWIISCCCRVAIPTSTYTCNRPRPPPRPLQPSLLSPSSQREFPSLWPLLPKTSYPSMPTLVALAFWSGYHHGTSPATITLGRLGCLFLGYWIWIPFSHWRSGPRCLDAMACMKGMRDSDFFCILVVDDWREQRRRESGGRILET